MSIMAEMIVDANASVQPVSAVARRLNVPVRWLREQVELGRIPGLRAGSQLLVVPEVVERILRDRAAGKYREEDALVERAPGKLDGGQ